LELLTDRIAIKYGFQIKQVGGELLDGGQLYFLVIDSCQCLGKERSEEEEERKAKNWRGGRGGRRSGKRETESEGRGGSEEKGRERMRGMMKMRNSQTLLYSLTSFITSFPNLPLVGFH